jgi:hypothetical protein
MDDFLHNLRNQGNKRFDRNRQKPYDGQFRPNDRFSRDRKNLPQQRNKPADSDQLPAIKRLIEGLLEQQRRLAEFGERAAIAAERQAEAIESIARHFQPQRVDLGSALQEPVEIVTANEDAVVAEEGDLRGTAAEIIRQQRDMGLSFEEIARSLNTRSIPTVSGKGQWRAQSVSRLYNTLIQPESLANARPADVGTLN